MEEVENALHRVVPRTNSCHAMEWSQGDSAGDDSWRLEKKPSTWPTVRRRSELRREREEEFMGKKTSAGPHVMCHDRPSLDRPKLPIYDLNSKFCKNKSCIGNKGLKLSY